MKRAAIAMTFAAARRKKFRFGFLGLRESKFGGDGDVSIQLGIQALDAGQDEPGEFDRREFAFAEEFSDLLDGGEGQIGVVPAQNILSRWRRFPKVPMLATMNAMRN